MFCRRLRSSIFALTLSRRTSVASSSSGGLGSGLMKGFLEDGGTEGAVVGGGWRIVDIRREPGIRESAGSGVMCADFRLARMACQSNRESIDCERWGTTN